MLLTLSMTASSAVITQTLGDEDFFGFGGGSIGDPVPVVDFNNQGISDPLFTDRDLRNSLNGPDSDNDIAWSHDLSALIGSDNVLSVSLELPIGGIQDGDLTLGSADDRLFIEGIEVANAFDSVDQGAFGTGLFIFNLSAAQVVSFSVDGILDVAIDGAKVPSDASATSNIGFLESYFIDYSRVNGETDATSAVPEPTTLLLLGLGLAGLGFARKRMH